MIRALLVLALFACGCSNHHAVRLAEVSAAANSGHAADPTLPVEARIIARDNLDAWRVVLAILRGDPLPEETAKRVERGRP